MDESKASCNKKCHDLDAHAQLPRVLDHVYVFISRRHLPRLILPLLMENGYGQGMPHSQLDLASKPF